MEGIAEEGMACVAADDADAWNEWRRQQGQQVEARPASAAAAAAGYHMPANRQQQQPRGTQVQHKEEQQQAEQEDMRSPPVSTQRPEIRRQVGVLCASKSISCCGSRKQSGSVYKFEGECFP
jgi:hypothetical protein